jgi:hypothetical protein
MCDAKLQIPFQTQELSINEDVPFDKISIPYKDPTTFEDVILKSISSTDSFWTGKISFQIIGDICDYSVARSAPDLKDSTYIEANGILKVEQVKVGPMGTDGGVIQFRRLYFQFRDLEVPIKIKYYYDIKTICDENISLEKMPTLDSFFHKTIDVSGETMEPIKEGLIIEVNPTEEKSYSFGRYFVTNGDNEKNMNTLFNNLEPEFRKYDTFLKPLYQSIVSGLNRISLSSRIETELKRIICASKKSSEETIKNSYILYNQKINILKELNLYSIIRNNY